MTFLLIASDAMEFAGLLARSEEVRTPRLTVDWARAGRLGSHHVLMAANGVGAARAAAGVDAALGDFRAEAVVSTGFCGALDPRLRIADIVVGTSISGPGGRIAPLPEANGPAHCAGQIHSTGHVVQTAQEKRKLYQTGACAVEMEAAGVASRCLKLGLPFYCIRSVTDLAEETLSTDFNGALRRDGHFGTMRILGSVLRHPSVRLPEVLRLRKRCIRASYALGDFFAACRF